MTSNIDVKPQNYRILFWLGFAALVLTALSFRFYDLKADPGNNHKNGAVGYVSESSSLPKDEQHYIKPVELNKTIGLWVVDPPSHFDFNTAMTSPVPQLQYNIVMRWFSRSIEVVRGYNSATLAVLALIFVKLAAQMGASRTATLLALSLFTLDFLFFSYNRLAHMETQVLLWSALALLCQNYAMMTERKLKCVAANLLVGVCFGALLFTKSNIGALFGLSFAASLIMIYAPRNILYLVKQTATQFLGFILVVALIIYAVDIPLQFYKVRFSDSGRALDLHYTRIIFELFDPQTWETVPGQLKTKVSLAAFYEAFYYYFHVAPVPALLMIFMVANAINHTSVTVSPHSFIHLTVAIFFAIYLGWFSVADYLPPRYFCHLIFFSALLLASLKEEVWGSERLKLLPYWIVTISVILAVELYPAGKANIAPETQDEFVSSAIWIGCVVFFASLLTSHSRVLIFRVLIVLVGLLINLEQIMSYQLKNPSYVWYDELSSYVGDDSLFNRDIRILNGVNDMSNDVFDAIFSTCDESSEIHVSGDYSRHLEHRLVAIRAFSLKSLSISTASYPGENTCVSFQNAIALKKLSGGNALPWYEGPGVRIVYTEALVGREFDPTYRIFGFR